VDFVLSSEKPVEPKLAADLELQAKLLPDVVFDPKTELDYQFLKALPPPEAARRFPYGPPERRAAVLAALRSSNRDPALLAVLEAASPGS
jgi:hypothetical protein